MCRPGPATQARETELASLIPTLTVTARDGEALSCQVSSPPTTDPDRAPHPTFQSLEHRPGDRMLLPQNCDFPVPEAQTGDRNLRPPERYAPVTRAQPGRRLLFLQDHNFPVAQVQIWRQGVTAARPQVSSHTSSACEAATASTTTTMSVAISGSDTSCGACPASGSCYESKCVFEDS